ncbi:MAG: S9 family peptidase [Nannocystaceae bacterium]|nr:S9 family peptidase [Nannocystaceae bacterium]
MLAMDRLSDPVLDGRGNVVFVRRVTDLEANRGRTDLWRVPVAGGEPQRLTSDPAADDNPQVGSDGTIYFVSARGGERAVWKLPAGATDPVRVTDVPLPVSSLVLSPKGDRIAFSLEVFVDCPDLACTKARLDEQAKRAASGVLYDRMFVRHWDSWADGRRNHLFTMPTAGGEVVDVTRGLDADVPSKPFGGPEEIAFSPDGTTLVFGARDAGASEPWSTNFDLYAVPADGSGERKNLTEANRAWDSHPRFSADGKTLYYKAMKRPGYEADRFHLVAMAWPDGAAKAVTDAWDRSIDELAIDPDGKTAWVTADDLGRKRLFAVELATGTVTTRTQGGSVASPLPTATEVVLLRDDLRAPAELFRVDKAAGEPVAITTINTTKVAAARMGNATPFEFEGAGGDIVHGWVVEPVDFDPTKLYPVALLIHGGPQGSFGDHFHYRWNPQAYAGAGFGAVMIDFHGSTGYGQAFTDAINDDWGGKPLVDLDKGLEAARAQFPWLDTSRACALGASYGGYMINWIAGKLPERFRCLVNHDGLFDMRSMYYATEELWFPEWEHRGPQYLVPKRYELWNPANLVAKWKTPMLVIHGALDFRVPETQGLSTFTALQRRGIESRYLRFPDENHWVLKPANSLLWHETVLKWLADHTPAVTR